MLDVLSLWPTLTALLVALSSRLTHHYGEGDYTDHLASFTKFMASQAMMEGCTIYHASCTDLVVTF